MDGEDADGDPDMHGGGSKASLPLSVIVSFQKCWNPMLPSPPEAQTQYPAAVSAAKEKGKEPEGGVEAGSSAFAGGIDIRENGLLVAQADAGVDRREGRLILHGREQRDAADAQPQPHCRERQ